MSGRVLDGAGSAAVRRLAITLLVVLSGVALGYGAAAHHVLGRPGYSLNEDSNTPPSMQAEVLVGDYMLTYMAFPAFPRPGAPGRINLYAVRVDTGAPFAGKVTFKVRHDPWYAGPWYAWLGLAGDQERLGVQSSDDKVFRQRFVIPDRGDYIITAEFEADGESYVVDFPLRVGESSAASLIGLLAIALLIALVTASVLYRRRSMTAKVRAARPGRG